MIPIVISVLFQQIYTISDAAIVGQTLSESEVNGVNNSNPVTFMILQFSLGCTAGFSVVTSKAIGKKDPDEARKSFLVQIILCAIIGVILTVIGVFTIDFLLKMIGIAPSLTDQTAQSLYVAAHDYIFVIYIGFFAPLFYNLIVAVLRSIGDSLTPLLFLIASTILNIGLDLLFIIVFHWGVIGAAVATIFSQFLAALGCFIYTFIRYKQFRFKSSDFNFTFKFVLEHLKVGLPLAFQFSILAIGLIIMQKGVILFDITPAGKQGVDVELGLNSANKLGNFLMSPFDALGTAMLSYMGQNYGSRNLKRIRDGYKQALVIGTVFWVVVASLGLLLTINGTYQRIFLSPDKINETTIKYGNMYLYLCCPAYIILMVLFVSRNSIQGIQKSFWPFLAGVGELIARCLVCSYLPPLVNGGPINSLASDGSFLALASGDCLAWFSACLMMLYPTIHYIIKGKFKFDEKDGDIKKQIN